MVSISSTSKHSGVGGGYESALSNTNVPHPFLEEEVLPDARLWFQISFTYLSLSLGHDMHESLTKISLVTELTWLGMYNCLAH
jgi:hypothetical protein